MGRPGRHIAEERLKLLLELSPRFADYYPTEKAKIDKKLRITAKDEGQQSNLMHELEVLAHLVDHRGFKVKYERAKVGPDIQVTFEGSEFWVEVTEVAESSEQTKFDDFIAGLKDELSKVESPHILNIGWCGNVFLDEPVMPKIDRTAVVATVKEAIQKGNLDTPLPIGGGRFYLRVQFAPKKLQSGVIVEFAPLMPILPRNYPSKTLADKVEKKNTRGQFRPDRSTILVIRSLSMDLENINAKRAVFEMVRSHGGDPDDQTMRDQRLKKLAGLSGVVFQSPESYKLGNFIWRNPEGNPIPEKVWKFFDSMPLLLKGPPSPSSSGQEITG